RAQINQIEGLYCFGEELLGSEATYSYDPTKLTIHISKLGITGHDVEIWLREHANIEVELSDMYNILCLITPGDTEESVAALTAALKRCAQEHLNKKESGKVIIKTPEIPVLSLSPRDALYAD